MSKKNQQTQHDEFETVEHALSTSEQFLEKNQKPILYAVSAVVLVILAVLAFSNYYLKPQNLLAANEMYKAQQYFEVDSFRVALVGDGVDCIGFQAIAKEYSLTKSASAANLYAGIASYKIGEYQQAIAFLKKYKGRDQHMAPAATQLMGDAFVALEQYEKAVACYKDVAAMKNDIFSPMSLKKAGIAYEALNQPKAALKAYTQIKENYPMSTEAMDIEKYIARVDSN